MNHDASFDDSLTPAPRGSRVPWLLAFGSGAVGAVLLLVAAAAPQSDERVVTQTPTLDLSPVPYLGEAIERPSAVELDEPVDVVETTTALDPVLPESRVSMARAEALVQIGDFRRAAHWYYLAAMAAPRAADPVAGYALCLFELRRDTSAKRFAERSLMLNPDHEMATVLVGFMAQLRGDKSEAQHRYRQYLAAHPDGLWAEELKAVIAHLEAGGTVAAR